MKTDYNIMKTDCNSLEIIDDSSDEEYIIPKIKSKKIKVVKDTSKKILKGYYNEDNTVIEIGVDEVGRGPLFGRVYTASVILPKDDNFDFSKVKDSKKFYSKKKLEEAAEYVKNNSLMWHVSYEDEKKIDEINILQATQLSMHNSINEVCKKYNKQMNDKGKREKKDYSFNLLIDGNYFNPITTFNKETNKIESVPYVTIEGGDNKYASIAAASILAKVERDKYINELCVQNPELINHYGIDSNKGYGAKKHIEGIKEHGITIWHRRSFAPCKNYI